MVRPSGTTWIVAGSTVVVVSAFLLVRMSRQGQTAAQAPPVAPALPAPDISDMSPRERADRLYNRVMSAAERGDTAQMHFFTPMALDSYTLLGELDPDARYHVGVIRFVNGDLSAALAQADSITREVPRHLLAGILRIEVARQRADPAAMVRTYRDFLSWWSPEVAASRPEYAHHKVMLDSTAAEARRVFAGSAP